VVHTTRRQPRKTIPRSKTHRYRRTNSRRNTRQEKRRDPSTGRRRTTHITRLHKRTRETTDSTHPNQNQNGNKHQSRSTNRDPRRRVGQRETTPEEQPQGPHGQSNETRRTTRRRTRTPKWRDDDDDDNDFHEAFPATHTTGSDGKILGNLPSAFNGDRARAEEFLMNMKAYFQAQHQKLPTTISHDTSRHVLKQHGRTRNRGMEDRHGKMVR
jgi:hypothetical protein